jgi:hypothetical protein
MAGEIPRADLQELARLLIQPAAKNHGSHGKYVGFALIDPLRNLDAVFMFFLRFDCHGKLPLIHTAKHIITMLHQHSLTMQIISKYTPNTLRMIFNATHLVWPGRFPVALTTWLFPAAPTESPVLPNPARRAAPETVAQQCTDIAKE